MRLGLHHSEGVLTAALLRDGQPALTAECECEDPAPATSTLIPALLERAGAAIEAITSATLSGLLEPEHVLSAEPSLLLITTKGFSDVLILGRQRRWALYDNSRDRPRPLVPRHRIIGAVERLLADGSEHRALDETRLRTDLVRWQDRKVDAVAVSLLHAYANDAHERRVAEVVSELLPGTPVSCSAEVAPVLREYERTATTVIDAACAALFPERVDTVAAALRGLGLQAPIQLITGQGLALPLAGARHQPALILGGSSSAAATAAARSEVPGLGSRLALHVTAFGAGLVTLGTGEPHLSDQTEIGMDDQQLFSGWPLALPAAPPTLPGTGPATRVAARMDCLALGNRLPEPSATLADALAVAGWTADRDGAADRLQAAVARPLGLELGKAATTTLEVAAATLAETARLRLVGEGMAAEAATLIAVGRWAPVLAPLVAMHLQCRRLLVPVEASASSAIGAALAATGLEQVATAQLDFNSTHSKTLDSLFARLAKTAENATGLVGATERRQVRLRLHGTGIELYCALPAGPLDAAAVEGVRREFVVRYRSQHPDHPLDPQAPLNVTAVRLRLVGPDTRTLPAESAVPPIAARDRLVRFSDGELTAVRAICWSELLPSGVIDGPLVVILNRSELVLPPGCRVGRHSGSTLVVTRREESRNAEPHR